MDGFEKGPSAALRFDPVWFGIFMVVMAEIGQVTPPAGFNLFVLRGMMKRDIFETAKDFWVLFVSADRRGGDYYGFPRHRPVAAGEVSRQLIPQPRCRRTPHEA